MQAEENMPSLLIGHLEDEPEALADHDKYPPPPSQHNWERDQGGTSVALLRTLQLGKAPRNPLGEEPLHDQDSTDLAKDEKGPHPEVNEAPLAVALPRREPKVCQSPMKGLGKVVCKAPRRATARTHAHLHQT